MAGPAGFQIRQDQVSGLYRLLGGMTAFARLGRVRVMIEPAMHHITHRLIDRHNRPIGGADTWRLDDMAIITGPAGGEDCPDSGVTG